MNRRTWVTLAGLLLALGIWTVAVPTGQGADEEDKEVVKEAQGAVIKLMEAMEKGGDGKKEADGIRKKFDALKPSMYVFKPRDKGGIGVGPAMKGDGIELKII